MKNGRWKKSDTLSVAFGFSFELSSGPLVASIGYFHQSFILFFNPNFVGIPKLVYLPLTLSHAFHWIYLFKKQSFITNNFPEIYKFPMLSFVDVSFTIWLRFSFWMTILVRLFQSVAEDMMMCGIRWITHTHTAPILYSIKTKKGSQQTDLLKRGI